MSRGRGIAARTARRALASCICGGGIACAVAAPALAVSPQYSAEWAGNSDVTTLESGETGSAFVRARNTGSGTWLRTELHLGTVGPPENRFAGQDRLSVFADATWLSASRPAAIAESQVAPGGIGTFLFNLRAPEVPATQSYREYFAPVREGYEWLDQCPQWCGVHIPITVLPAAAPTVRISAPSAVDQGTPYQVEAAATDNGAVDRVVFKLDGTEVVARVAPYRATFETSALDPGSHVVTARAFDRAGREATDAASFSVRPGTTTNGGDRPPEPGKISINEGQRFTNTRLVRVTATPPAQANTLTLANDGGFDPSIDFPLSGGGPQVFSWTLDDNQGQRDTFLVFARFSGPGGATSAQDSIILDQTRPRLRGVRADLANTRRTGRGVQDVVRISMTARDTISGVAAIAIRVRGERSPIVVDFRKRTRVSVPRTRRSGTLLVSVVDGAGNASKSRRVRVKRPR